MNPNSELAASLPADNPCVTCVYDAKHGKYEDKAVGMAGPATANLPASPMPFGNLSGGR